MRLWRMLIVVSALFIALGKGTAYADIPNLLAWQGVALDSLDQPLADGTYQFTFSIWDDGATGTMLWDEVQNITVENGVLNVLRGNVSNPFNFFIVMM